MTSAEHIIQLCHNAKRRRWRTDALRLQLEDYYNGGRLPADKCAREIISLGLGNRHLRNPHKLLRATLEHDEGPMKVEVSGLDDVDRITDTADAIESATKEWCKANYRGLCTQLGGEFVLCGRAFAWRNSRWDARFKFGRPLHAKDASVDISDDSFHWWAFPYKLTMRDLDHYIETTRGDKDSEGWQGEGLRKLKRSILEKKLKEDQRVTDEMIESPMEEGCSNDPLFCYIYFEKSGERDGEHRKVHMKIVSRHSEKQAIDAASEYDHKRHVRIEKKNFSIKHEEGKEQVIYSEENAFESVFECLIPFIEDARISGEQYLDEISGDGEQFINRLVTMETLSESAIEGAKFANSPHFASMQKVDKRVLQRLQETGLPPFTVTPPGLTVMDKANVVTSSRVGMEVVGQLGLTVEEEAATNKTAQFAGQRNNPEFAAQANQDAMFTQEVTQLRFTFWHSGWDLLWEQVGKTLTRLNGWAKADPSYYDAMNFRDRFKEEGGRLSDLRNARLCFKARRLPGGADQQTAMNKFMLVIQNPNTPAEMAQWATRELFKLLFGSNIAKQFLKGDKQPSRSQLEGAVFQTNAALGSLLLMQPEKGDDPLVHLREIHFPALQQQIQLLANQQTRTPRDTAGIQILIQHMTFDIANLPGAAREQAMMTLSQLGQAFAAIPEQAPIDERMMQQQKMQIDMAKTQNELQNGENLRQVRVAQLQQKEGQNQFSQMATAKGLAQNDARIGLEAERQDREAAERLLQTQN